MRNPGVVATLFRLIALVFIAATGVALAAPGVAFAADEPTSQAREHFEKGKAFMDLGKYNEAAAEYEAAYAAKPDPALLLNLAQAYRQAGNAEKAVRFYRKYLEKVPKTPYREDIEEKIAALEKQMKSGDGATTTTPPAGSGTTTEPPSGGTNGGSPPYTGGPPPPPPPSTDGSGPAGYPMVGGQPEGPPPGVDPGKNLKLAGLVTGGAGVLLYAAAAVFGAQAKDAARKVENAAALNQSFEGDVRAQDSRGRSAQTKEVASIIIGTLAVAGGGVLYYIGTRKTKEATMAAGVNRARVALLPAASATDVGAMLWVRF